MRLKNFGGILESVKIQKNIAEKIAEKLGGIFMLNQLITKNFVDRVYETATYTAENNDNVTRYGVEKMLEMWAQNKANLYEFLGNNLKISTAN